MPSGQLTSPRTRTFAVLFGVAVLIGLAEFVAAAAIGLGCTPGGTVACYGPQNGIPAAPGYWLGTTLEGVGFVLIALVALVGLIGLFGVRALRRRAVLIIAVLALVCSAATAIWSAAVLGARPSAAYCRGAGDGCNHT